MILQSNGTSQHIANISVSFQVYLVAEPGRAAILRLPRQRAYDRKRKSADEREDESHRDQHAEGEEEEPKTTDDAVETA